MAIKTVILIQNDREDSLDFQERYEAVLNLHDKNGREVISVSCSWVEPAVGNFAPQQRIFIAYRAGG